MKKINLLYICLAALVYGPVQAKKTNPVKAVSITPVSVVADGDSLRVALNIRTERLKVRTREGFSMQPSIENGAHSLSMPRVEWTGRQRYKFDRRDRTIYPDVTYTEPYARYTPVRKNNTYMTDYAVAVPYQPWMADASLFANYACHDCCSVVPLDKNLITGDLGLTEPEPAAPEVWSADPSRIPQMVCFLTPQVEAVKSRSENVSAFLNFKRGSYVIYEDFSNNPAELRKVDELLTSVIGQQHITVSAIQITGYASPEGTYASNDILSRNRANSFKSYATQKYNLQQYTIYTANVPEDWDGLIELLKQTNPVYKDKIFEIINSSTTMDGRESKIIALQGGAPFREMLEYLFPKLRRIEVRADYVVDAIAEKDLRDILFTRPGLLSLEEMYRVTKEYTPGTREYREVYEIAARIYPNDVIAANNAAAAAILMGDLTDAKFYLNKIADDPRSFTNQGVVAYLEGDRERAADLFSRAAATGDAQGNTNLQWVK